MKSVSHPDVEINTLAQVALRYDEEEVPIHAEAGRCSLLWRACLPSLTFATDSNRPRRAFVSHYCNARSRIAWDHGSNRAHYEGADANGATNHRHILARGAVPTCPTPSPSSARSAPPTRPNSTASGLTTIASKSMMGDSSGFMVLVPQEDVAHDH